jgi:hypothetical protein
MPAEWPFPGSRWWKCDLHLHTPASHDFENREGVTAEEWVAAALEQGLEIVAVTDHNSGKHIPWITKAAEGRNLSVFPGVEITANGGCHLLSLFDPGRDGDAVTGLLALCGIPDQQIGTREACASCSFEECLRHGAQRGALNIAPHVDDRHGILKDIDPNQTLQKILGSEDLHGVEVKLKDPGLLAFLDNTKTGYVRALGPLPQLTFSDAHALDQIGRRYTWIKMTSPPSLEGLRLALEDGAPLSVKPCSTQPGSPNAHAAAIIESVEVESAKYMGRETPFLVPFNPWLNAIVGGRGTGKSSLLELLRIALRRDDELPEALKADFASFKRVPQGRNDRGLLLETTRIRVVYRKDGARFRIQWAQAGDLPAIETWDGSGWVVDRGDVKGRFPVRIYSQRQIFEIARQPGALLTIADDSIMVDRKAWQARWDQEESRFLALRARAREIRTRLADADRLEGELLDVTRKLGVFETSGHAEVLREFQRRRRQQRDLEVWEESLRQSMQRLAEVAAAISPPALETGLHDRLDEADATLLGLSESIAARIQEVGQDLGKAVRKFHLLLEEWQQGRSSWAGSETVLRAQKDYEVLIGNLQEARVGDPSEYGHLVQSRHTLEQRLADLEGLKRTLTEVEEQCRQSLERLGELRQELTRNRQRFLEEVVGKNPHVRIEVVPYGDKGKTESELQGFLQTPRFPKDQDELLSHLYEDYVPSFETERGPAARAPLTEGFLRRLHNLKESLTRPEALRLQDQRFARHLAGLNPEAFDRLAAWFPEDALKVTYSRKGTGADFVPLDQGSPGQKAAAILAFLLSYGEEPMLLDQPEDDLDNQLISDLVVRQLRENKARRQVIVVTHNPNIVVNADAELVLVLDSGGGQTRVAHGGGLQERQVREEVCRVMEGGREALERRYRRIGRRRGDA